MKCLQSVKFHLYGWNTASSSKNKINPVQKALTWVITVWARNELVFWLWRLTHRLLRNWLRACAWDHLRRSLQMLWLLETSHDLLLLLSILVNLGPLCLWNVQSWILEKVVWKLLHSELVVPHHLLKRLSLLDCGRIRGPVDCISLFLFTAQSVGFSSCLPLLVFFYASFDELL